MAIVKNISDSAASLYANKVPTQPPQQLLPFWFFHNDCMNRFPGQLLNTNHTSSIMNGWTKIASSLISFCQHWI